MKTMKFILATVVFLQIATRSQGLEMSFDLNVPMTSGYRAVCGVLTCEQTYTPTTHNTSERPTPSRRTVFSLSIFRITEATGRADAGGSDELKHLVAVLTPQRPKISRVSDGVKVDGSLEAGLATLRLELVKEIDCSAQYSCEVRTSDTRGGELVQTNRLRQKCPWPGRRLDTGGTVMTSGGISQQLASLQQQITLMFTSLAAVQNRLEDKIETRVVDKLCHLETKLSHEEKEEEGDDGYSVPRKLNEVLDGLKYFREQFKDENQKAARINALIVSNSTRELQTTLQGRVTEILSWEQKHYENLRELISINAKTINSSSRSGQGTLTSSSDLKTNLNTGFEKLRTDVKNISTQTLSAVHDLVADTNTTVYNSLKPALVDVLSPQECTKGMFPSMLGTIFPYHVIEPNGKIQQPNVPYLCDSVTEGGGWIVIQRRVSGGLSFYRNWADYKDGFGSLYGEFWWGNENVHAVTNSGDKYELRVDLKYQGRASYAHYSSFSLDGENNNYALRLGEFDGTAGDSLTYHNGRPFSTHDRDNDGASANYAVDYSGAWWYYNGYHSNLNALWNINGNKGARWHHLTGSNPVTFCEMKIRKL